MTGATTDPTGEPGAVDEPRAVEIDRWLRSQGLPTLVPRRRWLTNLPRRVAPLAAWLLIAIVGLSGLELVVDIDHVVAPAAVWIGLVVAVGALAIVLLAAWLAYRGVRRLLARHPGWSGEVIATLLVVGCTVLVAVNAAYDGVSLWLAILGALLFAVASLLLAATGGGALLSWSTRMAARNASAVGHMASIALPVNLLLVVFAFFSAEVWQLTAAMSWAAVAGVGGFVAALATAIVLSVSAGEIDGVREGVSDADRRRLVEGTPARRLLAGPEPIAVTSLNRSQRVNVLLVMGVAQLVQALCFAVLLGGVLVILGTIAITPEIVELWVGEGPDGLPLPVEAARLGALELPITVNLLKSATLLAELSTLAFVLSAVSEARYRARFFEPIVADMRQAIAVFDVVSARDSDS